MVLRIHRYGYRALGLTEDVLQQKYENEKEGLQKKLAKLSRICIQEYFNIYHRLGYRAMDPNLAKTLIHQLTSKLS